MANGSLRICLDPGHSINYNRGIIPGYFESNMNWNLANYLKEELLKYKNTEVFITKSRLDSNPDLESRGRYAIQNNCEVFYSIHSNAASAAACGVSVFRSVKRPDSVKLGQLLGQKDVDIMKKDTGITYLRQNGNSTRLYPNTTNTDYYGVIRASVRSDVVKYSYIIEHGFHTNPTECTWLMDDSHIRELAKGEADVLASYFGLQLKDGSIPTPEPTPSGEIKVGDIIDFAGGGVYSSANASTPAYNIDAGKYLVTQIYQLGKSKHPYSLNSADGKRVYGWVDADKVSKEGAPAPNPDTPIEIGDIVQFAGGPHYSNANASEAAGTPKAGPAKVSAKSEGAKHPYHIIHTDSQSSVYGWVDSNKISKNGSSPTPGPAPVGCPYPEPTRQLHKGDSGEDVKWVQWYLCEDGYNVAIDGKFGSDSDKKVRQFQGDQGIKVDGWVGNDTKARLKNPQAKKTNPYKEPTSDIRKGGKGEGVKWIQLELVEAGYNIAVDGSFGPATDNAVRDFQKKSGLKVDGWVGKDTRAKLKAN